MQRNLHICGECESTLVHPLAMETRGEDSWWLELHCPECDWVGADIFGRHEIEVFETELDRGHEELTASLLELVRVNMSEYVDRFIHALTAEAIYPMDF
jgi:hypothetical protein